MTTRKITIKQSLKCSYCRYELIGAVVEFTDEHTARCPGCNALVHLPTKDQMVREMRRQVEKELDRGLNDAMRKLRRSGAKVKIRKR